MTKQEIFDKVVAHLRTQGARSVDKDRNCMYRTSDGRKCAAGACIDDAHYSVALERKTVSDTSVIAALLASGIPEECVELINDMQMAHDYHMPRAKGNNMASWETRMETIAKDHGLEYTPCKQQ